MEQEIWKDIPGYSGLYQISNLGRIRSYPKWRGPVRLKAKILKPRINQHGYKQKILVKNGIRKTYNIHRLVAMAFIPNPYNKKCIDHINTIKTDNRVENLRWVTHKENSNNPLSLNKHIGIKGPWAGKYGAQHPNSKKINQYTKDGKFVRSFDGIAQAERELGIYNIYRSLISATKMVGGYFWRYAK